MKEEILSKIRPFVFHDVIAKVSGMLDQYRCEIEKAESDPEPNVSNANLLRDQVEHLMKAMTMIAKVPENSDGAMMAKGIAGEAISAVCSTDE